MGQHCITSAGGYPLFCTCMGQHCFTSAGGFPLPLVVAVLLGPVLEACQLQLKSTNMPCTRISEIVFNAVE